MSYPHEVKVATFKPTERKKFWMKNCGKLGVLISYAKLRRHF